MSFDGDVRSNGKVEVEDNGDGLEAGPKLPLDVDGAEDEEGRFFGGGLTATTTDVLDLIEEREQSGTAVSRG